MFQLPDEVVLAPVFEEFPCRESQIRNLATLVYPFAAPCRNIVIHGVESTGKSDVTAAVLDALSVTETLPSESVASISYGVVKCIQCITARHLFEKIVFRVRSTLGLDNPGPVCESMAQLAVELSQALEEIDLPESWRFVLVLDNIDRQREAPFTMLAALARLSEIIPQLTTIFIMTCPPPLCLREAATPHIHFPNYKKQELVSIVCRFHVPETISRTTEKDTRELWPKFCGAVHDALIRPAARTLPAFLRACENLWPKFVAPIIAGNYSARDFSRLLIAARMHFQNEKILDPGIIRSDDDSAPAAGQGQPMQAPPPIPGTPSKGSGMAGMAAATPSRAVAVTPSRNPGTPSATTPGRGLVVQPPKSTDLISLPLTSRLLLLAAYLASHNQARHDSTLFCTSYTGRRRRRGGMVGKGRKSKHRKIARKLLGASAFVMERMLAIFAAVRSEWAPELVQDGLDGDVGMAFATLASLRLLVRVGATGADPLDRSGKWRVNVGWEVVRGVGRSIGVELEDWLID